MFFRVQQAACRRRPSGRTGAHLVKNPGPEGNSNQPAGLGARRARCDGAAHFTSIERLCPSTEVITPEVDHELRDRAHGEDDFAFEVGIGYHLPGDHSSSPLGSVSTGSLR